MKHNLNELYTASLKPRQSVIRRALYSIWTVVGLSFFAYVAWAEPWSVKLFNSLLAAGIAPWVISFVGVPVVMGLRAVILAESVGYFYHRFFQHVGFLTRRAQFVRQSQKFHWIHHMILYPIGRFYKRNIPYRSSEKGLGLSWLLPAVVTMVLFVWSHGFTIATLSFVAVLALYLIYVVNRTHDRFHEAAHPWVSKPYFQWLEKIHVLHHYDQRTNFTIVHPLMDILFGTYLNPKTHQAELNLTVADEELTVSDLINWRYLLLEATPAEYAAFVSSAKKHRRSVLKLYQLLEVLKERISTCPNDSLAMDLNQKACNLLTEIGKMPSGL